MSKIDFIQVIGDLNFVLYAKDLEGRSIGEAGKN
jgi:hypothetical protein